MIITRSEPGGPRFVQFPDRATAPSASTTARRPTSRNWPDGSDTFWIGGDGGYQEQVGQPGKSLVGFDAELDPPLPLRPRTACIATRCTSRNALIDENSTTGGTFEYVAVLGGYFEDGVISDPGNWFEIDEVVAADQHIGPPELWPLSAGRVQRRRRRPNARDRRARGLEQRATAKFRRPGRRSCGNRTVIVTVADTATTRTAVRRAPAPPVVAPFATLAPLAPLPLVTVEEPVVAAALVPTGSAYAPLTVAQWW